ncbi:MAG: hypothetical protein NZ844_07385, partial [Chloroherpetonaceae bacterium]|nr:hypothetical protein [Chloroherpetonaceae bacterium]
EPYSQVLWYPFAVRAAEGGVTLMQVRVGAKTFTHHAQSFSQFYRASLTLSTANGRDERHSA